MIFSRYHVWAPIYLTPLLVFVLGDMTDPLRSYNLDLDDDLTAITFAHAVNSMQKLNDALKDDKVMAIEADITLGTIEGAPTEIIPIMGHPPVNVSDLSLEEFLRLTSKQVPPKAIKLDFKSKEVFEASVILLEKFVLSSDFPFPLLLNADILVGPGGASVTAVDADFFLSTSVTRFPSATLSLGWTTGPVVLPSEDHYTPEMIAAMTDALNRNCVTEPVTFAVRAALTAKSYDTLVPLIRTSTPGTTLTIWSSVDSDVIDVDSLRILMNDLGRDKTYLDVPEDVKNELLNPTGAGGSRGRSHTGKPFLIAAVTVLTLGSLIFS